MFSTMPSYFVWHGQGHISGPALTITTCWSVGLEKGEPSMLLCQHAGSSHLSCQCFVGRRNHSGQISPLKIEGPFYHVFSCFILTIYIPSTTTSTTFPYNCGEGTKLSRLRYKITVKFQLSNQKSPI